MLLRTAAARRAVLLTFVLAAAMTPPVFAKARSARDGGPPASPPVPTASAPTAPNPGPAAGVAPATPCGSCEDNDPCTVDRCDTQTGQCVHPAVVCDDQSPCTNDSCEAGTGCRFDPVPDGTACPIDFPCQPTGTCQVGQCTQPSVDVVCSDGIPCTYDYCDYQTGQCGHQVNTCDDGNGCTADACDAAGQCHHTVLPRGAACDDNNPCTVATSCRDPGMGGLQCLGTPTPEAACDDGNLCTVNDSCAGAFCQGTPRDCNDSDACSQDSCDGQTGQCVHQAQSCDDKNACTTDACSPASGCSHTPLEPHAVCDDGQPCTGLNERCDFGPMGFNCYGQPLGGTPCDDGSTCTTDDVCRSDGRGGAFCAGAPLECSEGNACTIDQCFPDTGACRSMPVSCNDYNSCTDEVCSLQDGCQYTPHPEGTLCDDLNPCSTGDVCTGGYCYGAAQVSCDDQLACTFDSCDDNSGGACLHTPRECDDANPCTDDTCGEPGGTCLFAPRPDGTACSTQNACTTGEVCESGQCTGTGTTCDDGNPCTTDVCDPVTGGCLFVPISCSDHNGCTADSCDAATGECRNEPISCDDGEFCTADICNPAIGTCQHTPANDGFECDDGNACTLQTSCNAGTCGNGTPTVCNDNNFCTQNTCNPATGCEYPPLPDGTACSDGNICTTPDRCTAGQCAGAPKCQDFNVCTDDMCNPQTGQCAFPGVKDPVPCSDGNACTPGDHCLNSQCVGGPPPACADGDACTSDSCDPATGSCRFLPRSCDDNSPCTQDSCNPATGCLYDPLPNGSACNDGDACITGESCQYGQCVGLRTTCNDGSDCTYDQCDSQTGLCQAYPQCNDGNPCTDDVCLPGGGCDYVAHDPGTACDDGNVCTTADSCVDFGMGSPQCRGTATQGAACDDGNPCTHDDVCADIGAGTPYCTGTYDSCSDGQPCTSDYCDPQTGQCAHDPLNCDDRNPCTIDSCGPAENQCSFQPVPAGTACNDSSGCLIGGTCGNGPLGFGCNGTPNVGAACDDHNFCTEPDRCQVDGRGNVSCRGNPITCNDDGLICTNDYCDPGIAQCRQSPIYCDDGDVCTLNVCDEATASCTTEPGQPDEVSTLNAASNTSIQWSPTASVTHWNSYRGTIPADMLGSRLPGSVYDHACYESANAAGDGALVSTDASLPPIGTAYYYDATGEAACGEGPLGRDSAGAVRPNTAPCPTPP